jgi:hypothetical protein
MSDPSSSTSFVLIPSRSSPVALLLRQHGHGAYVRKAYPRDRSRRAHRAVNGEVLCASGGVKLGAFLAVVTTYARM